jgi:hypothetical protein
MKESVRGEVDEPFRVTLNRAFALETITQREFAKRLGLQSQVGAFKRLAIPAPGTQRPGGIREDSLRQAAHALGYRLQLTLVPMEEPPPTKAPATAKKQQGQLTLLPMEPPPTKAPAKKPKRRRKDADE